MNSFKQKWLIFLSFVIVMMLLAACGGGGAAPATSAPSAAPQVAAPTKAPQPASTAASVAITPPTAEPPTVEPATVEPATAVPVAPTQPAVLTGTKIDMNNPIFKAYYAVYNKFPRRAQAEVVDTKTQRTSSVIIETDARDHLHVDVSSMAGTKNISTSMIIISPTMYLKMGTTWQKLPGAQAGSLLGMFNDADSLQQLLNTFDLLANYTVSPVGPEDVNGVPAMAYTSEFTLKDGKISKGKAWVGADGLLLKDTIETSGGIVVTTTYDFDPGIKVEAPIP